MITKPSEIYFKDGIWAWDAANSTWVKLEVDASGYLKIVVSGTAGLTAAELNLDGAKDLQVDVKTSALPTGAATSAKQNQLEGWDGAAWRKLPLVWGYSDRLAEYQSEDDATAGINYLTFTAVPAGYVYVVEAVDGYNANHAPLSIEIQACVGSVVARLYRNSDPVVNVPDVLVGRFTLTAGDVVRVRFEGCTLNDNLRAHYWGYKMKVTE